MFEVRQTPLCALASGCLVILLTLVRDIAVDPGTAGGVLVLAIQHPLLTRYMV